MNSSKIMALAVVGIMIASGFVMLVPTSASATFPIGRIATTITLGTPTTVINTTLFNGPTTSMVQLLNGHYLGFVREGTSHVSPGDYAVMKLYNSTDGTVWTYNKTIVTVANRDVRNYAAGTTQTGRAIVFFSVYDCDNNTWGNTSLKYIYSDDDGASWSVISILSLPTLGGFVPHDGTAHGELKQLGGNRIGLTIYVGNGSGTHLRFVYSDDNGGTWSQRVMSGYYSLSAGLITEADIAYLGGSRLVVMVRQDISDHGGTYSGPWNQTMFTSTDNGLTWSNRGIFEMDDVMPPSLSAFTDDQGQTWVLAVFAYYFVDYTYANGDDLMSQGVSAWSPRERSLIVTSGLYATGIFDSEGNGIMMMSSTSAPPGSLSNIIIVPLTAERHYTAEQESLINLLVLIPFFLTLGVVLIPITKIIELSKQKRMIRVDEVVRMVMTIVVGFTLVGITYVMI